jgi:hypothetical protein
VPLSFRLYFFFPPRLESYEYQMEQKKEQWAAVEVWLFLVRGLTGCCG